MTGQAWYAPDIRALTSALGAALEGRHAGALRVLLGADLCRHWVLQMPEGIRSWADLQALAQARATALFGAPAAEAVALRWILRADWRSTGSQWCAAVPSAWIEGFQEAALAYGVRVQVFSAMQVAWQRLHEAGLARGLLAWTTPGHLVVAQADARGGVHAWRALRRPPASVADVADLVRAEVRALAAVQPGIDPTDALQMLTAGGHASAQATPAGMQQVVAPWIHDAASLADTEAAWAARLHEVRA